MTAPKHLFIIGAQRCGTSYLYELLDQHPQIEMATPRKPEPKFFLVDELYEQGIESYEQTYFTGKPDIVLRGEKSTSYLESASAAERIARHCPDAAILVLVRDPIERALSHYRFSCDNGVETLPFDQAIRQEPLRAVQYDRSRFSVSPYAYLQRGRYLDYLSAYESRFTQHQIHVIQTERLLTNNDLVYNLLTALGVLASNIVLGIDHKVNASSQRPIDFSSETRRYMVEYFYENTLAFSRKYDIDLALWPSMTE